MDTADALLESLARALREGGVDVGGWLLAWARLIPSLLAIPAFGLPGLPMLLRLAFAALLGLVLAPALAPGLGPAPVAPPSIAALAAELARGVPAGAGVAIGIWSATMAGNLLDELAGSTSTPRSELAGVAPEGPFGTLAWLAAVIAFFQLDGPGRLLAALAAAPPLGAAGLRSLALAMAGGIRMAVALAGPWLALAPMLELLVGLVSRAASPGRARAALGPLRSLVLFAAATLLLDRFATGVVLWLDRSLPPS